MKACYFSTILKVPPYQIDDLYKSVAIFTMPTKYFEKGVKFFLLGKDDSIASGHSMPNGVIGETEILDDPLKKLFFAKDKKN
jgi:hypothetical protein